MGSHVMKRLPPGVVPSKLVGEGAANAVFKLQLPQGCADATQFQGWLLRVSKAPAGGGPSTFNYKTQQAFYLNQVKPLLGEYAVKQELVDLRGSGIVPRLNALLQEVDQERRSKFQGSQVAESDWGMLVEDMEPEDSDEYLLFEMKPKWMVQSPSAPPNAIRCRQCAMELYNFLGAPGKAKHVPEALHCPLTLANEDALPAVSSPHRIAPDVALNEHIEEALANTARHQLFADLRAAQEQTDPDGPLNARPDNPAFVLCMTLRDCTCFVTLARNPQPSGGPSQPVKLRLGDFDLKDVSYKFERWQATERNLAESGCYTAEWILCDQTLYHAPTRCLLEWSGRPAGAAEVIAVRDKSRADTERLANWTRVHERETDTAALLQHLLPYRRDDPKTDVCPFRVAPP